MIREITGIMQKDEHYFQRWFTDSDYWDIYTWEQDGEMKLFQVCYDRGTDNQHAINWQKENGNLSLFRIVEGHNPFDMGAPILMENGAFRLKKVTERLKRDVAGCNQPLLNEIIVVFDQMIVGCA